MYKSFRQSPTKSELKILKAVVHTLLLLLEHLYQGYPCKMVLSVICPYRQSFLKHLWILSLPARFGLVSSQRRMSIMAWGYLLVPERVKRTFKHKVQDFRQFLQAVALIQVLYALPIPTAASPEPQSAQLTRPMLAHSRAWLPQGEEIIITCQISGADCYLLEVRAVRFLSCQTNLLEVLRETLLQALIWP